MAHFKKIHITRHPKRLNQGKNMQLRGPFKSRPAVIKLHLKY